MNLEYFPHFIRKNYPCINITDEEINVIGKEFKQYLKDKFKGDLEKLDTIWNIDAKTIIMNEVSKNPFLINGYHPALIIHFGQFSRNVTTRNES